MPDLFSTFAVLKPGLLLDTVDVADDVYERLEKNFNGFHDHVLIAAHRFTEDWPTWECHPEGDELVILMSGSVTLLLRRDGTDSSTRLSAPGEFAVVPKGTWHTAHVEEETTMLFVTPGEGTENLEAPPSADL